GVATESQARECLRLGAVDFVGKPLPLGRLQEVLADIAPLAVDRKTRDRRRYSRVPLTVPVRVADFDGAPWDATSVAVSVAGIRHNPEESMRFFRHEVEVALKMAGLLTLIGLIVLPVAWGYQQRRQARTWQNVACAYRIKEVTRTMPIVTSIERAPDACTAL